MEPSKVLTMRVLTALAALAHQARLDLVRLLMPLGDTGMAAGDIGRALNLPASRLSFHLAALEQAGLIRSRRVARNVIYSVDADGIGATIAYLLNDCCRDNARVQDCCRNSAEVNGQAEGPSPRVVTAASLSDMV